MIFVTGATGKVGREVVKQLLGSGADVRAMVRDPDSAELPLGADVVAGDLNDPGSLERALDGVEAVFLLWPFITVAEAQEMAPPVVAAIAGQAKRVVYLSAQAAEDPASFYAVLEREIEASGLEWTFVRPTGFAANVRMWGDQIEAGDVVRWPFGEAARSLIHERDVAAVAVCALVGGGEHAGQRYVISGPEQITQAQQVRQVGAAIGRPLRWQEVPAGEIRDQLAAGFGSPDFADHALEVWESFIDAPESVTDTVTRITGRPPSSFGQWAREHAREFV